MRTFLIVWIGQLASMLGSEMTNFAITIWAWSVTGKATPLSFILFFTQTPKVFAALFAGVLVDRTHRQKLMIVGDLFAVFYRRSQWFFWLLARFSLLRFSSFNCS